MSGPPKLEEIRESLCSTVDGESLKKKKKFINKPRIPHANTAKYLDTTPDQQKEKGRIRSQIQKNILASQIYLRISKLSIDNKLL